MILKTKMMRPAIAMLELIFAIVIMGIILMSAPMLISTAAKSGYVAIQQEAINEAASQVNMIMGYHWDENSANEFFNDPILSTGGDVELNEYNISGQQTGRRHGTPKESYRAFVRSDGQRLSASAETTFGFGSGKDNSETEKDDIDDFIGLTHLVLVLEPTLIADNVETTTIDINTIISYSTDSADYNLTNITYNPFTSSGGTTNIKSISITLTSTSGIEELNKKIILHAFSCNIGGYELEERDF